MLKVLIHPNPTLRKKSREVADVFSGGIKKLIPEMIETMKNSDGAGLAAPQVGENIRLIVASHKDQTLVIFNPKIIKKSILKEWGEEGCLSVPNTFGEVKRCKKITIQFLNKKGLKEKLKAEGLLARVIQHEIDHLNGILFIDKAKKIKKL